MCRTCLPRGTTATLASQRSTRAPVRSRDWLSPASYWRNTSRKTQWCRPRWDGLNRCQIWNQINRSMRDIQSAVRKKKRQCENSGIHSDCKPPNLRLICAALKTLARCQVKGSFQLELHRRTYLFCRVWGQTGHVGFMCCGVASEVFRGGVSLAFIPEAHCRFRRRFYMW